MGLGSFRTPSEAGGGCAWRAGTWGGGCPVAKEQGQAGAVGESAEGRGDPADLVPGRLIICAVIEQSRLNGPGAAEAPVGGGHFLDHAELDAIEGAEAVHVVLQHSLEVLVRLAGHNDALGEQAMAHGVICGTAFALGRCRSPGAGAVSPRRKYSSH